MKVGVSPLRVVTLVLVLNFLVSLTPARSDSYSGSDVESMFTVDVPVWRIGDYWTYDTHLHLTMGLNKTDLFGTSTYQVTSLFSVRQNGTYYEAYNVSVTGSFTGTGSGTINSIPFTVTVDSASLSGYQWFDRSDLSLIRDNETISASGSVHISIFSYPMELRFDSTSNRSPSQEDYDFPLLPGDTWTFRGNMRSIGYYFYSVTGTPFGDFIATIPYDHNTSMDFDAEITEIVDLNVGGTVYHSYHITETPPANSSRSGVAQLWYAPSVKNAVRQQLIASTIDFVMIGFTNLTSYSIAQQPVQLSFDLDPQVINPGGFLNVTGRTGASAGVRLLMPWNESSLTTTSSPAGDYSFRIRAPSFDDNTPAPVDVGSHGVIVEATAGVSTSYNASTIVLQLPDLFINQNDITFSSPPVVGVETTIQAVVHASAAIGVHSPVSVEFLLNGSFFSTDSTAFILAGGQHTFTTNWTPGSSVYTVGVLVDPSDTIIESDKSNNFAEISVAISLPDLVPWDIDIRDGTSAHYTNPATTGYISPVFNASRGETLTVTFDVMNRGNASANGSARFIAVETQGLRGPPSQPPILDTVIPLSLAPGVSQALESATWPVPAILGTYYINLTVDSDNSIAERGEGNNTFVLRIAVGAPDLSIAVLGPSKIHLGGSASATVEVSNSGNRPSPATSVEVRDAGMGTLVGTVPVNPIGAGGLRTEAFGLGTLTSTTGQVCLRFTVDPSNLVNETDETNNEQQWCFEVTPLPVTTHSFSGLVNIGASYTYIRNTTGISLQAVDNSGTGIRKTEYSVDGGNWTAYAPGVQIRLTTEGTHTFRYNSTDNLGGTEAAKSITLFVDDIAPVTVAEYDGERIFLNATENGSGLAGTYYRLNQQGDFLQYVGPIVVGPGSHLIEYFSIDRLQNSERTKSRSFSTEPADGQAPSTNLKPYIAVAFAIIILTLFLLLWRKGRRKISLLVALVFIALEVATGVASLGVDALSISPGEGKFTGLFVDIAILIAGLLALLFVKKPVHSEVPKGDSEETS